MTTVWVREADERRILSGHTSAPDAQGEAEGGLPRQGGISRGGRGEGPRETIGLFFFVNCADGTYCEQYEETT